MIRYILAAADALPGGDTITVPSPQHLADEHHLLLVILILIVVVILVSGGKGIGKLIDFLVGKLLGKKEVVVNINEDGPATDKAGGRICQFSPDQCREHRAEFERSQRNVQDIENLKKEFSEFKTAFFSKLNCIETGVNEIKVSLASTMTELRIKLAKEP